MVFSANEKNTEIEILMPAPLKCWAEGGCSQISWEWVGTRDGLGAGRYDYVLDDDWITLKLPRSSWVQLPKAMLTVGTAGTLS